MPQATPAVSRADSTRQQLLDAAAAVFADHYFDGARVTDIATRAGQPVSAINYHFGGKLGLYQAMLEHLAASLGYIRQCWSNSWLTTSATGP